MTSYNGFYSGHYTNSLPSLKSQLQFLDGTEPSSQMATNLAQAKMFFVNSVVNLSFVDFPMHSDILILEEECHKIACIKKN